MSPGSGKADCYGKSLAVQGRSFVVCTPHPPGETAAMALTMYGPILLLKNSRHPSER